MMKTTTTEKKRLQRACPPKLKRRRAKTGPIITPRDQRIFDTLHSYGLVREATLHALHFEGVKHQRTVQATLKRLADAGYIGRRFLPPVHRLNDTFIDYSRQDQSGAIYFLDRVGANFIGRSFNPAVAKVKINYLNHKLDIADIRACFELALRKDRETTCARWFDENEKDDQGRFILHDRVIVEDPKTGDKRKLPIRPDACLLLQEEKTSKQEVLFLECDEGTESGKKRWRDKVTAYRRYARQGFADRYNFNGQGFRVITITRTPSGKNQEKRAATLLENTLIAGGRKQFWISTFSLAMPQGRPTGNQVLSSPIWQRAQTKTLAEYSSLALSDYLFDRDFKNRWPENRS